MNLNHQSCNCGNLAHVYGVSQCCIIMEIIICKSSVILLVSLLIFSSVFITLHDKHHFFEICNSVKMLKNYTHMKVHSSCNFFCGMRYLLDDCSNCCHLHHCGQVFTIC